MLIEEIIEDNGALWTEGSSLWLSIGVIIKKICYRLLMVTFVLASEYFRGRCFEPLFDF